MSVNEIIKVEESIDRIFPILNKFDRIYTHYNIPFCAVYNMLTNGKSYSDIEFTQLMEQHINENNIK